MGLEIGRSQLSRPAVTRPRPKTPKRSKLTALGGTRNADLIPLHALDPATILALQRTAGNLAVSRLVVPETKKYGWTDAEKKEKGHQWNAAEHLVGRVHRIPLEGLLAGYQGTAGIPELTKESAAGKAIVLVQEGTPEALYTSNAKLEVVIFLHGYTESAESRPFAGYRALDLELGKKTKQEDWVRALQQGIDDKDVMPVRDVALDQAEAQLEESNQPLTIMVLPQGGLTSQFGGAGGQDFDADAYVREVISRINKDYLGTNKGSEAIVGKVTIAGHSGASSALGQMAREANRIDDEKRAAAKAGKPYTPSKRTAKSSALTGDLILFDAINWSDLPAFKEWATNRLNEELAEIADTTKYKTADDRRKYLAGAPKLIGYYSTGKHGGTYATKYENLQDFIDDWFANHKSQLASLGVTACLKANFYVLNDVPVSHEELMRGTKAGQARGKGEGSILKALQAGCKAA